MGLQHEDEGGYIVYERTTKNKYLEQLRENKKSDLDNEKKDVILKRYGSHKIDAANFLIKLGKQEREKEIDLMTKFFGDGVKNVIFNSNKQIDYMKYIDKINELMVRKKRYEQALRQIARQIGDLKRKVDPDNIAKLAPTLSSLYFGKFEAALKEKIKAFLQDQNNQQKLFTSNDNLKKNAEAFWNANKNNLLKSAADKAFKDLLDYEVQDKNKDKKDVFGLADKEAKAINKQLKKLYESDTRKIEDLWEIINQKTSFSDFYKQMISSLDELKITDPTTKKDEIIKAMIGNIKIKTGASLLGGSINEFINELANSIYPESSESVNQTRVAHTFKSEMLKIDGALWISFAGQKNNKIEKAFKGVFNELESNLKGNKTLLDAADTFNDMADKLNSFENSFIIFTSGKAYGLETDFFKKEGFTGGSYRSLEDLDTILRNINFKKTGHFIDLMINTIDGAVLHRFQTPIENHFRLEIEKAIAYLLFDDWKMIGNKISDLTGKGSNAIHVFTLDDINIPLSYFLIELGNALGLAEANLKTDSANNDFVRVAFKYKNKKIEYPTAEDYPEAKDFPSRAYQAWEHQREIMQDSIKFQIHFLRNFKDIIRQIRDSHKNNSY